MHREQRAIYCRYLHLYNKYYALTKFLISCSFLYFREKGTELVLELLWGQEYITETILGKKFRVSPDAFLQVTTLLLLYS